jgi:predicted O-methyltransferase YrrM
MPMNRDLWTAVDRYAAESLLPTDPVLERVLARNRAAGLPAIDVSPLQGRFLELVVRMSGARNVLEIGTLGGYSTIWMARALPGGGRLTTLEREPRHAEVARENIAAAGLAERVDLRVGPALGLLEVLDGERAGPFDLVFIDADKPNNAGYLSWAVRLGRPGTVIICDNVVRGGAVADGKSSDAGVKGARAAFAFIGGDRRLAGTAVQTVGEKGYDGFAIAIMGEERAGRA